VDQGQGDSCSAHVHLTMRFGSVPKTRLLLLASRGKENPTPRHQKQLNAKTGNPSAELSEMAVPLLSLREQGETWKQEFTKHRPKGFAPVPCWFMSIPYLLYIQEHGGSGCTGSGNKVQWG